MRARPGDTPIAVAGVPDGLYAYVVRKVRAAADGSFVEVRDRRGRRKPVTRVILRAARDPADGVDVTGLADDQLAALRAITSNSFSVVARRLGLDAWDVVVDWVRRGLVEIECEVDDRLRLGPALRVVASDEWLATVTHEGTSRAYAIELAKQETAALADAVCDLSPELSQALRSQQDPTTRVGRVLAAAASDLITGERRSSPRAFSQAHFDHTKHADDVAAILRTHGVSDEVAAAIGVERTARVGLAGPVLVELDHGRALDLTPLSGPTIFRCAPGEWQLSLLHRVPLMIVENLQAAESICDLEPGVACVYCAGMPSEGVLDVAGQLATDASRVFILCDADLGGVRIADRLSRVMPKAEIIDVGAAAHDERLPWPDDSVSMVGLRRFVEGCGPAADLAAACAARGYPVEQEGAIVAIARSLLADTGRCSETE